VIDTLVVEADALAREVATAITEATSRVTESNPEWEYYHVYNEFFRANPTWKEVDARIMEITP